jgi:hypothetical protein
VRRDHPSVPVATVLGDFGHQRAANKKADRDRLIDAIFGWFDHHVRGQGPAPPRDVMLTTQTCPRDRPSEGPFRAPTLAALADDEVRFGAAAPQTISSVGGDPATGRALDPVSGGGDGCIETGTAAAPGTAVLRLPAAGEGGVLLVGAPRVEATLAISGEPTVTQVAARLWDVAPDGGTQRLVARGTYRPTGAHAEAFELHPVAWRFERGHVAKLELLGVDAPYGRPSNTPFSITASDLVLRLPVRRRGADAAAVGPVRCASKRRFRIHVSRRLRNVHVRVDGRRVRVRRHSAVVDLRGKPRKVVRVRITGRTAAGHRVVRVRRYRTCVPGNRRGATP